MLRDATTSFSAGTSAVAACIAANAPFVTAVCSAAAFASAALPAATITVAVDATGATALLTALPTGFATTLRSLYGGVPCLLSAHGWYGLHLHGVRYLHRGVVVV